jgi:hypothetical protein
MLINNVLRNTSPETLKMVAIYSFKMLADINGLHGIVSQKTELFITSAASTSHPKNVAYKS